MAKIHNHKYLKDRRRKLRQNLTSAEAALWSLLKGKQLKGRKFRRQHSIGNYIVDSYCPEENLAIELDGDGHFTSGGWENDQEREEFLRKHGIKVIRFENNEVFHATECVLEEIMKHFTSTTPP
jgi:very-short-patch-repair endonuclease